MTWRDYGLQAVDGSVVISTAVAVYAFVVPPFHIKGATTWELLFGSLRTEKAGYLTKKLELSFAPLAVTLGGHEDKLAGVCVQFPFL